jgi:hypothetical protein
MKQAQNAQKRRGRPSSRNNGKSHNSNRNEPKVRGNPKQLTEKYKNQAREALQAGDRMQAEYYFQFADHYQRVLNEMRGPNNNNQNQNNADQGDDAEDGTPHRRRNHRRNHRNRNGNDGSEQNQPNAEQGTADTNQPSASDTNVESGGEEKPAPKRRRTKPQSDKSENDGDNTTQEQPREVHPELNLEGEVPAKPVRKRSPVRRKRIESKDAEAAPKPSTGDEAA